MPEKHIIKGARAIILDKNKILLVHRIKQDKEYFVLPGGAIENDETPEQTVIREVKEETNLDIELDKKLWFFVDKSYNDATAHYFLVKSFKGNIEFKGPEKEKITKTNKYILEWIPLKKIKNILLYPEIIKERIIKLTQSK